MQLSFSPQAALDLEEIAYYIERDHPERALSFLAEIQAHCYRVAEMPNAFPRREDLAPGLQMAVHGNYLIKDFLDHCNQFFKKPVFWKIGYFVSSTGGANLETVKRYIKEQDQPESDKCSTVLQSLKPVV